MGFNGSNTGFISGVDGVSVQQESQFIVGAGGDNPTNGTSVFNPSPSLYGSACLISLTAYGYLTYGVQFTITVVANRITAITLLTGLLFNAGEVYTVTSYYP